MRISDAKRLPVEINRRGAKYKIIKRGTRALLYARSVKDRIESYETFLIKIRPEGAINGNPTPASEIFPHDEAFGIWAKCTYSKERAEFLFNQYEKLI